MNVMSFDAAGVVTVNAFEGVEVLPPTSTATTVYWYCVFDCTVVSEYVVVVVLPIWLPSRNTRYLATPTSSVAAVQDKSTRLAIAVPVRFEGAVGAAPSTGPSVRTSCGAIPAAPSLES